MEDKNMTMLTPFRSGSYLEKFFDDWDDRASVHTPDIQIKKNDKEYQVRAKLPGAKKNDIHVEVENGYLKISGKYEKKEDQDFENVHSEFRSYTEFHRSLALDLGRFEIDKVNAKFEDGVLEVTLPLKEIAKAKQISIKG